MSKQFTVTELRCLELSRIIREGLPGIRFDMSDFRDYCGTAACIAGLARVAYDKTIWRPGNGFKIFGSARSLLGLSHEQATDLFMPWEREGPEAPDITPAMAAGVLGNFALTGKVEWPAS